MPLPKILIVIEHEPADQHGPGSRSDGAVVGVHSNLPPRYLDVVVNEWQVTKRDAEGTVEEAQGDTNHPRGEAPFNVPFEGGEPYDPPFDELEDARGRHRTDDAQEWVALFWDGDKVDHALILRASDVVAAAERLKQEFPRCRIVRIEEVESDQDHPMAYLDQYEIILPVGGPRVQQGSDTTQ